MKKTLLLFFALSCSFLAFSQTVKVHSSELSGLDQNFMPDEMGFVQMTQDYYNQFVINNKTELSSKEGFNSKNAELFDGFPVTFDGSSDKNAIYYNLDDDDELEMIFTSTKKLHAYNIDGSVVDGWPTINMSEIIEKGASLGDITGDGVPEIIVATRSSSSGWIYAFNLEGEVLDNFPINHGFNGGAPTLYDIDDDGKMEIIISKRIYPLGEVYIYNEDGTVLDGWPKGLPYIPTGSISVADIDDDDEVEIIAAYYDGILAFEKDGTEIFNFVLPTDVHISYSSPVIANLDCEPGKEIAFATVAYGPSPAVYVIKNDGTIYPNWPKYTTWSMYAHVSLADMDEDGSLDIFCCDQILGADNFYIYGWNIDGENLSGFPIETTWAMDTQLLIADIDNDQHLEIISDDNITYNGDFGYYHAFNHDGTVTDGWPLEVTLGGTFYKSPTLLDADNDGVLDFLGASGTADPYTTSPHLWSLNYPVPTDPTLLPLTTCQYNLQRTGEYPFNNCYFPVEEVIVSAEGGVNAISIQGGTLQMIAEVLPLYATNPNVIWSISAGEEFASIDENGLLSAIADGVATVLATSVDNNDISDELDIEITNQSISVDLLNSNISLYPNPTTGVISINSSLKIGTCNIVVMDIMGQIVYQNQFQTLNRNIDLSNQAKGIYFITIKQENSSISEKIIIK